METSGGKKVVVEIRHYEKKASLFELGHPLLNTIADSFVKAAGVGALQAVSREAYFNVVDGESRSKSFEALIKNTGKESLQWGLAAGLYSGITYGMKEVRGGAHDWKNSVLAGALTGAAMAMTSPDRSNHEQVVQSALTGAAISAAANLLSTVF
ncbi:unnamed protein product [Cochlearia groenlandica]